MAADPTEAKELSLVGKVELRIALADSQDKLRALLATYLCPILLKLASPHKSVKDKVISICQHINTRTRSNPIRLPVADLLQQFKKSPNATVRHFDLLYVEQGLEQLSTTERTALVPLILQGLSSNFEESPRNTAVLFNMFLRLLQQYPLPSRGTQDDRGLRAEWKLDENPKDAEFLAEWIGKLMLFQDSPVVRSLPGLASSDAEFLKLYGKDSTWNVASGGLSVHDTKLQATKFLWTAGLSPAEKFIPSLLAAGSTVSRVSDIGEEILKSILGSISLEDHALVAKLFSIFLGDNASGRPPAHPILKGKILRLLCKSREAATHADSIVALTTHELRGSDTSEASGSNHDRGLEASKLRKEVFSFVIWVARMAPKQALQIIAPAVVGDLRSYIETQGWPKIHDGSSMTVTQELVSRQRGYESIGLLAQACPQLLLLEPSLELLGWLFSSLVGDVSDKETSLSIESTLAIIMHAFGSSMDQELEEPLTELLLNYTELAIGDTDGSNVQVRRSPRFVAVRFANRCFPFDHLSGRWIDLLALSTGSDERQEVVEEGTRGLDPYWFQIINPADSMNLSPEEKEAFMTRHYRIPATESTTRYFFGSENKRGQLRNAFVKAVLFCRNVLFHNALSDRSMAPALTQDWERSLEVLATGDNNGRLAIAEHLDKIQANDGESLLQLVRAAFDGFLSDEYTGSTDAGTALCAILSLGPKELRSAVIDGLPGLLDRIYSSNSAARASASQIFAMLASSSTVDKTKRDGYTTKFLQVIREWQHAIGAKVHQTSGAILTMAHMFCHMDAAPEPLSQLNETQSETVSLILSILFEGRDQDLVQSALQSLDQLFIYGILTDKTMPAQFTSQKLLQKLYEIARSGKEIAVACLGHFAMQSPENMSTADSVTKLAFDKLEALHDVRQPELHFSVGSALSCLAVGWSSQALVRYRDAKSSKHATESREGLLEVILSKVLEDCSQTKPSMRQAAAVWLLCLLQDCDGQPQIHSRLKEIHSAFRNFLSDRDTLNQETASRGLALVYETGNKDIKDELIRDLVRSFTSDKSNLAGTVSDDTELFDPGALPTGDGSVTTYKDIVNLANEVGDPSLVYRFMAMASNSAIWSSRAAFGRFGLSKVLADASESGYLAQNPKLYSTLYRYRFDPNSNVRNAMNEIWKSLVVNSQQVIDDNFDQILEDLLKNILGKEWRTRQGCCAAIADLVQMKPMSRYEKQITDIWNAAFKVCDDIKGSVRKAAMTLVKALTNLLTRNLEHGDASMNNRILTQVIPFLCGPQGLESSASDVRLFALGAIIDIVKKGDRTTLQPYLGELVANHLLPSFTSVEPDVINYAYMKPANFNVTTEQIDNSRLSNVKLSPMMEAIERCLEMLDETSMKDLTTRLAVSMKSVIGVPSKIGVSRVIVTLSTKHNMLFRPHGDQLLKILRKQALDKNDTVSTSAAAACGYLSRVVSDGAVLDHIQHIKTLYFQASDEKTRFAAADLTCATVKHATDRAHSFAAELFPFIFVGMHDTDEATSAEFKTAWEEMVGGPRTIRLYLKEIAQLVTVHIDSAQWAFKHASSLAIADGIQRLGNKISDVDARTLWPPLDKALTAKTWDGKEKVLQAFTHFVQHAELAKQDTTIRDRCRVIAIREAKRNNTGVYRQQAVKSLGLYVETRQDVDWYESVSAVLLPIVETLEDDADAMDIDDDSDQRTKRLIREETLGNCVRSLLRSIDPKVRQGSALIESLADAAKAVRPLNQHGALVQGALFEAERDLMQRLSDATEAEVPDAVMHDFLAALDVKGEGVEAVRLKSAEVVEAMAKVTKAGSEARAQLIQTVESWASVERSKTVQEVLRRAKQALGA